MNNTNNNQTEKTGPYEITPPTRDGIQVLVADIVLTVISIAVILASAGSGFSIIFILYALVASPIILAGLKIVRPGEALVLTLFGRYHGTLRREGFYFVNPFCAAVPPPSGQAVTGSAGATGGGAGAQVVGVVTPASAANSVNSMRSAFCRRVSLKAMTFNNDKQKINDSLGNPIIIGIMVIWRVENTVKALFNVDNYVEFLSTQCDSSLRNIVRMYPYDASDDEKSLRGSSQEIAEKLKAAIQEKVAIAGLEVMEARITNLAYAPEIAAAMLQRQQATAIVAARQLIVDGAVGMVELALNKLKENAVIELDEERKAAMVSNLLVVLCGNKDAQPIVNSGSIY